MLEPLNKLGAHAGEAMDKLHALSSQYERADVELWTEPQAEADGRDGVLKPQPRATGQNTGKRPPTRERQLD